MPGQSKSSEIVYRIARSRADLEQAYALVYQEYKRRGYIPKYYKSKLRLSLFNALPSTTTFIAQRNRAVVATVSLVPHSGLGVLMDKLFVNEVDSLRRQGRRVAEVSQLALETALFPDQWFSMFNFNKLLFLLKLFKLVLDYAVEVEKLNDLCIAFNPRHRFLYKFLGFEQIGNLKYYGAFHSPALAMRLNLDTVEQRTRNRRGLYRIFFSSEADPTCFEGKYQLTAGDLEYFFIKKSDFLIKATTKQLRYLKACYPGIDFEKMIKQNKF